MNSVTIRLPLPPSSNHHWRMVMMGTSPRMLLSAEGRVYRRDVAAAWLAHHAEHPAPVLTGPLRLSVIIAYRDRRKIDLDNRIKPLQDALAECGAIANDNQIDELIVRRGPVSPPDGYADICLEPLTESNP